MGKTVSVSSDISAISYDALSFLGDVDLGPEKKTLAGIGGMRITTMGDFTVCVRADDVELDATFHVAREGDIVLENDIFVKVGMSINLLGSKFINKNNPLEVHAALDHEEHSG